MLNNSYKKIVVDANGDKYESYKTIRYVHETPVSENSSNLQINNNKAIMTINSLELTGGETATTDDIVVTRSGKNLFDWSAVKNKQIVIEENGRKIIMPIRTESNSNGYTGTGSTFRQLFPRLKAGDTATLSFNSNAEIKKIYISTVYVMWASGQTMTVTEDMLDCAVAFYGNYYAHGQTEQVIISDFQMEIGTTATSYEPYLSPKSITFSRDYLLSLKGVSNLLDKSKFPATQTINGITYTNNGDGTVTADGTAESGSGFRLDTFYIEGNKTYLMRGCPKEGATNKYFMFDGYSNIGYDLGSGVIKTISGSDSVKCSPILHIVTGNTVSNLVFKPELYDLTAIYGEGNEPTTVEQFLKTYPLSSADKLTITKNSVKYNDTDITSEVTGLDDFIKTDTNTAIIDTNYVMGSISADVDYLYTSCKTEFYTEEV